MLSILLFFASCGNNVCEKTIEKLALTENGFCNISLGEDVYSIVNKLGDVDPANYSHMFSYKLEEIRNFNGVNALVVASFPCIYLASDYSGNGLYTFNPVNASELIFKSEYEEWSPRTVKEALDDLNKKNIDASELILPATTLANYCYNGMFASCTSLTTVPELPAMILSKDCYSNMFMDCTGLTAVPALHVTTLADNCYTFMFSGCTGLTTVPENLLPATTLAEECYYGMFSDCTSLVTAPKLPATTLAEQCYLAIFYNCTSLIEAPELPATTLAKNCYGTMFYNCTSLTTAPELPATILAEECYGGMFNGCTSLTTAPELPATTLAEYCYEGMFSGCSNLNYIKALFTTDPFTIDPMHPDRSYTYNWVNGVSSIGTFVKNKDAKWNLTGVNGIPSGWTVETV